MYHENYEGIQIAMAEISVAKFTERLPFKRTLLPALKLHMFNWTGNHRSASLPDALRELQGFRRLCDKEIKASKNPHLPSIGTEIEVPSYHFPLDEPSNAPLVKWFEKMGLSPHQEITERKPTEFALPPTNSASAQNRMIYELQKAGFIPKDKTFASLHINLGVPSGVNSDNLDDGLMCAISDLLTYAFIPAGRIRRRGCDDYAVTVNDNNIYTAKQGKLRHCASRVEFRTPRIIGPQTFRLTEETQHLGVLLFEQSPTFLGIQEEFIDEVSALLESHDLELDDPAIRPDNSADAISKALREKRLHPGRPNLRDQSRSLMGRYAREISQTIRQ